ncbi:hypothetical protein [Empedobacter falsenii]|uniref:hypothetical protein n=1 Tax=Empedobacter falsenii TaxID=343874 RepID=UPI001C8D49B8|nr:hypothetical protein [Empedobacter falsenii]MBY0067449.1 hypothetical protein [Empedobacter falsenii]
MHNGLLLSFYTNRKFEIGQKVIIEDETKGVIIAINNICMTIQTENEKIVYPIKVITNKKIRIIED